jgi:hypothetical protein
MKLLRFFRNRRIIISITVVVLSLIFLTGCGSSPKAVAEKPQYCYTSQSIETTNGERVTSRTKVECTDDQVKRLFHVRSGMAPTCGEFTYWMQLGNQYVQRKGVSCQKPDGSWEVVNTNPR